MRLDRFLTIAIILMACMAVGVATLIVSERKIDYEISKSCEKNKAFQIKGVHYMCLEIQERKK